MAITSGIFFPPGGPGATHAARTGSLALDISDRIAMAAFGVSGGVLTYTAAASAWGEEANSTSPLSNPIAVANGYTLDAASGLWGWGGGSVASGTPPYLSMASGSSGLYLLGPSGLYTSGGTAVSGFSASGLQGFIASGASFWAFSASTIYKATLSSTTSASAASASLPFTATCIGASGSLLAIGGTVPLVIGSGAYAIATNPAADTLVAFPGGTTAQTWLLSGSPAAWSLLATSTGLPPYTSGISVAWAPAGNQILLSDFASGTWTAFSYTGGSLSLLTTAAIAGTARGLAISADSSYAFIPNPAGSGFSLLETSGSSWVAAGFAVSGLPAAAAVASVSGDVFVIGSSGQGALASRISGSWVVSQPIPLPFNPAAVVWEADSNPQMAWWLGTSGQAASTVWTPTSGFISASGTWTSGTAESIVGATAQRRQLVVADSAAAQLVVAGGPTSIAPLSYTNIPGLTALGGPFIDASIAAGTSGSIGFHFYTYAAPFNLQQIVSGVYATATSGLSISAVSGLGQTAVPCVLGVGAGGGLLVGTTQGMLGLLASGLTGLNKMLASGGFSFVLPASGLTWLATEVQGGLAWVSGL